MSIDVFSPMTLAEALSSGLRTFSRADRAKECVDCSGYVASWSRSPRCPECRRRLRAARARARYVPAHLRDADERARAAFRRRRRYLLSKPRHLCVECAATVATRRRSDTQRCDPCLVRHRRARGRARQARCPARKRVADAR